jgi:phosphoserine phosphatase
MMQALPGTDTEFTTAAAPSAHETPVSTKQYLLASDFDQTLSFNDSGEALSELLGRSGFRAKVDGLAAAHLVQQGGELAYLLLHDPEYRCVRRHHLEEVGRHIRLKKNIRALADALNAGFGGCRFAFHVISAAPEEVVRSALEGLIPHDHIHGTRFNYDPVTGEIQSVSRLPAGFGKVAVLDGLQRALQITPDRLIYVGDGSSDLHVMLHVNRRDGFTVAVSENEHIAPIARRTVLSDDALSVLVPVLEDVVGWREPARVRAYFETLGLAVQMWDKKQVDVLSIRAGDGALEPVALAAAAGR